MPITIDHIDTGAVRVRPAQFTQPPGNVLLRRLRSILGSGWTDPMPMYAYLIRHPEGNILFDTGESPRACGAGYFDWWQVGHHLISMDIRPEQGLGEQLKARGLDPKNDISTVVLSHLHSDHAGGLPDVFGKPTVYTSAAHWEAFRHRVHATLEGANPAAWPAGFAPALLEPRGPAVGPWAHSYPVTKDGAIVAVDTPGHVPGHLSLIVFDGPTTYFLAGDATYAMRLLDAEQPDGISAEPYVFVETLRKIKRFCANRDVVVLLSHDYDSVRRLEQKEAYRPSALL